MCPEGGYVVFRGGELMCGNLDKSCLGGSKKGLIHVLIRDHSPRAAADYMLRMTRVCTRWLTDHGFSIGIEDVSPSDSLSMRKEGLCADGYA